jgi:hypothetical protein
MNTLILSDEFNEIRFKADSDLDGDVLVIFTKDGCAQWINNERLPELRDWIDAVIKENEK